MVETAVGKFFAVDENRRAIVFHNASDAREFRDFAISQLRDIIVTRCEKQLEILAI